jgi:hypothetical protein
MIDIKNYIGLSKMADSIKCFFLNPSDFKPLFTTVKPTEKASLIRHFIINNAPYVFKEKPILYEQITKFIADRLQIAPIEVKLIGSAKMGFSMVNGKVFGEHSDLDFSIINEDLFYKLEGEFTDWSDKFRSKQIIPKTAVEEDYWIKNLDTVPRQLKYGFIDTKYIPNRDPYITKKTTEQTLWLIKSNLQSQHEITVKSISARIYKNWHIFQNRVNKTVDWALEDTP